MTHVDMPPVLVRLNLPDFDSPEPFRLAQPPSSMSELACFVLEEIGGFDRAELEELKKNTAELPLSFFAEWPDARGNPQLVRLGDDGRLGRFLAAVPANLPAVIEVRHRTPEDEAPGAPAQAPAPSPPVTPAPRPFVTPVEVAEPIEPNAREPPGGQSPPSPLSSAVSAVSLPTTPAQDPFRVGSGRPPQAGPLQREPFFREKPPAVQERIGETADFGRAEPRAELRKPQIPQRSQDAGKADFGGPPLGRNPFLSNGHSTAPARLPAAPARAHSPVANNNTSTPRSGRRLPWEQRPDDASDGRRTPPRGRPSPGGGGGTLADSRRGQAGSRRPMAEERATGSRASSRDSQRGSSPGPAARAVPSGQASGRGREPPARSAGLDRPLGVPRGRGADSPVPGDGFNCSFGTPCDESVLSEACDDVNALRRALKRQQGRIQFLEERHKQALSDLRQSRQECAKAHQQRLEEADKASQLEQLVIEMQSYLTDAGGDRSRWEEWLQHSQSILECKTG